MANINNPIRKLLRYLYWKASNFLIRKSLFSEIKASLLPGTDKKIVSFSLYGHDKRYFNNLELCIESYINIFPDWIVRVYVASDLPLEVMNVLWNYHCEVIIMKGSGIDFRYMYWRFLPLDDKNVSHVIIRDIDSLASTREKQMVNNWLESDKNLHIIRDHELHCFKIMGGIWGMKRHKPDYGIKSKMLKYNMQNRYGSDLYFLETIYEQHLDDMLVNDVLHRYQNEQPIILPKKDHFYIGQINLQS